MVANYTEIEKRTWDAADSLRANSELKSSEYSTPVLGLIFLRFADFKFQPVHADLQGKATARREITPTSYRARDVLYLPEQARWKHLTSLTEGENIGKAINEAMAAIEKDNPELGGILPQSYQIFDNATLTTLLKAFNFSLEGVEGDLFGKIYEYFLGNFAMKEGQKGGEFFTPISLVKLIVEIIEPYQGRIYDPACGSGGMFVQSAEFVNRHQSNGDSQKNISIYGQERVGETVRLAKMNLAVHGLTGDILQSNTYYDNVHHSVGLFDYVMANPPFNVNGVDKDRLKGDPRYPLGMPRTDNANYLWIQLFYSSLNEQGRAGFVMANSASDARGSEQEIRRQLLEAGAVDVMVAIGSNFFYTVTLPCTLWFLDKGKANTPRQDTVLFLDARQIFTQVDRAHREFSPDQLEFLANIVRLYRGEAVELDNGSAALLAQTFPEGVYTDVAGLCKVATRDDIAAQGDSLNPGRYVGVTANASVDNADFVERMTAIQERLEILNAEAHELEDRIADNLRKLLQG